MCTREGEREGGEDIGNLFRSRTDFSGRARCRGKRIRPANAFNNAAVASIKPGTSCIHFRTTVPSFVPSTSFRRYARLRVRRAPFSREKKVTRDARVAHGKSRIFAIRVASVRTRRTARARARYIVEIGAARHAAIAREIAVENRFAEKVPGATLRYCTDATDVFPPVLPLSRAGPGRCTLAVDIVPVSPKQLGWNIEILIEYR